MTDARATYRWYETIEGESIEQGDFLPGFEILVPQSCAGLQADEFEVEVKMFDLVVMTQTCDIENGKVDSLLLCPWWDLWEFIEAAKAQGENWGTGIREALRRGNLPGYQLLNEASQDGIGLVDFHEVYTAPLTQIRQSARNSGKRLRLCPPYREHLAQAFARFFMRVGLPVDIPKENIRK